MRRAAFLDRDGVLAQEIVRDGVARAPTELRDFRIVSDAGEQVERLRSAGLSCFVFTNQPEVARGLLHSSVLNEMHRQLRDRVAVDDILVCPHDDADGCDCRKPRPGMLQVAAQRYSIDLESSFVIGDRWRDIEAGRAVGCFTVLLERSYSNCTDANARVDTLSEAVDTVLTRIAVARSRRDGVAP